MRKETIKKMTVMAMLAALSMVLVYAIHVPLIPVVPFLEYDPADIPILIAAMAYGPVSGLVLTVVVSIIQGMFISTTGPWGILMHVIAQVPWCWWPAASTGSAIPGPARCWAWSSAPWPWDW